MVMSTVNLPINILASDFDDGVEISVEDENEDAPEVVDSEEALNEKDGDSSESDNRESFEENEKVEENAENNTFSEFTDGTDFSDGEDLDISDSRAVGNNEGFTPRTTAPGKSKYYYSDNPFQKNGYGMWDKNGNEQGNCTAYAWGRAYEILGTQPNLGRNNAGSWWNYNKNNNYYEYGSAPKIGAVAVWDKYDNDTGHVAVVEAIDGNNVTISESHWKSTFFDTRTIKADSSNYLTKMRFLGYIYVYNGNINPEPTNGIRSYGFDAPSNGEKIIGSTFLFQGWVDASKEINSITCSVNGGSKYITTNLYKREDVPNATAFRAEISSGILNMGDNRVAVCVNFQDNTGVVVEERTVNRGLEGIGSYGFDAPSNGDEITGDTFLFQGW